MTEASPASVRRVESGAFGLLEEGCVRPAFDRASTAGEEERVPRRIVNVVRAMLCRRSSASVKCYGLKSV